MIARRIARMMAWAFARTIAPAALALTPVAAAAAEPERIVAVGDLHGDRAAFDAVMKGAGLVDGAGRWTGGRTVLVQVGDVADRGPDSRSILASLHHLQREAVRDGGRVVVLVGNHEAMNITGDLRYVHPGEYTAFRTAQSEAFRDKVFADNQDRIVASYRKADPGLSEADARARWIAETPLGKMEHRKAWSPSGEIGRWLVDQPAVARLAGTLFVHGGISAEYARQDLRAINREIGTAMRRGESRYPSVLDDPLGPLWYRGNVTRPSPSVEDGDRPAREQELSQVLSAFSARRLVVGHTPNPPGIVADLDGRLVRIDTGMSAAYGGVRAFLEIRGDQWIAHEQRDGRWVARPLDVGGAAKAKGRR